MEQWKWRAGKTPVLPRYTVYCLPFPRFSSCTRVIGSTEIAPYRMIQCRCGPVTRPLLPTAPMRCTRRDRVALRHVRLAQVEVPRHQSAPWSR